MKMCFNIFDLDQFFIRRGLFYNKTTNIEHVDVVFNTHFHYRQPETVFVPQMFVPENGRHGNALAVSFFRSRARLRSRAHDFHCSTEKRCGKLGRYVSFTEIHVLRRASRM